MSKLIEIIAAISEITAVCLFAFAARLYHRAGYHGEEERIRHTLHAGKTIHEAQIKARQMQETAPLN